MGQSLVAIAAFDGAGERRPVDDGRSRWAVASVWRMVLLLLLAVATGVGILSVGHGPASAAVDPVSTSGGASPGTITFFYPASSLPPGSSSTSAVGRSLRAAGLLQLLLASLLAGRFAFNAARTARRPDRLDQHRELRVLDLVPPRRGPPERA